MKEIIKANWVYYMGALVFFLGGLVVLLNITKGDEILYFGAERNEDVDFAFVYSTKVGEAYIYIIAIGILLFYSVRHAMWVPLVALATLVASLSLKAFFATPRPVTYLYKLVNSEELCLIPGLYMNVGYNSFPSGHSMSAFAIFTFLALCLPNKRWTAWLVIPASLVAFSRVVITQHFLEDILAGSFCGLLLGTFLYYLVLRFRKEEEWYDGPILKDGTLAWKTE